MNELENDIANEIVNIGLAKAADSMAFFTKEKVLIRGLNLQKIKLDDLNSVLTYDNNDLQFVLTTELKGALKGICYLIFSESDVEKILKVSLPASILNDPAKLKVMADAILLEMDNIIVASVVTQFSNFFNYKMYGDVPKLHKSNNEDLKKLVISENPGSEYFMYFKAEMHSSVIDVTPEFIWMLDDKFLEGVLEIAQNDEVLIKLGLDSKK